MLLLHSGRGDKIAEIEICEPTFAQFPVEHSIMHLIGSDRFVLSRRNPAVPSAQHTEKPRPALIDDFAADGRGILLRRHAPAQIYVHEMNPSLQQFLTQLGKHEAYEMVPLSLHIPKSAADEDTDDFPSRWQQACLLLLMTDYNHVH